MVVNLACELIKDVNFLLLTQKNAKRITKCCLNKVIVKYQENVQFCLEHGC